MAESVHNVDSFQMTLPSALLFPLKLSSYYPVLLTEIYKDVQGHKFPVRS